ncbi:TadE/TadG family type IV pilus assembly protein [Glutamicibacter arilaitensis]|uniref:TadE/TadG family type IV pilus assembly protein n=1 Tax=Glutamicibacter arilaitensis TaxID=256701 RepID=UPI003FD03BC9
MPKISKNQWRCETGSSNVGGFAFLPIILVLIFGAIEFGLVVNADQKAHAVAAAAYNVARYEGSTAADGRRAANELLTRYDMELPPGAVSITRTATEVRVSVHAQSDSMLPFHDGWKINQEVSGPTERIIAR